MDGKQANELLASARAHLTAARKGVRGPKNDAGVLLGLTAVGEALQVLAGHEERIAAIEGWIADGGHQNG